MYCGDVSSPLLGRPRVQGCPPGEPARLHNGANVGAGREGSRPLRAARGREVVRDRVVPNPQPWPVSLPWPGEHHRTGACPEFGASSWASASGVSVRQVMRLMKLGRWGAVCPGTGTRTCVRVPVASWATSPARSRRTFSVRHLRNSFSRYTWSSASRLWAK